MTVAKAGFSTTVMIVKEFLILDDRYCYAYLGTSFRPISCSIRPQHPSPLVVIARLALMVFQNLPTPAVFDH